MPAFAPVTIAGLAQLSGVDADVIRVYLALGLVPQPRRGTGRGGDLGFHREHVDRLRFIARAFALGFSLDAIRRLLGTDGGHRTCGDVYLVTQRTLATSRELGVVPSPTLESLAAACPQQGGPGDCPILAELGRPPASTPTLADPQPMLTFDPSKPALLHEMLNDEVMAWDPRCARDWRRTADQHPEGVHWNGFFFDAWGTECLPREARQGLRVVEGALRA